VVISSLQHP